MCTNHREFKSTTERTVTEEVLIYSVKCVFCTLRTVRIQRHPCAVSWIVTGVSVMKCIHCNADRTENKKPSPHVVLLLCAVADLIVRLAKDKFGAIQTEYQKVT